ncbi:MAG TPA: Plug domain-containing protein [Longimicrobiales bacterium]|nr:Plug domain-containing protein [Longimicrobiales bacterium]
MTDSVVTDTIAGVDQDTVIVPAVQFPAMPLSPHVSPAGTEWVWTREMLLREAYVDLADLLERIPGVTAFRAGSFVQPQVAAAFGGTAARTEIVIDGYHVDPLSGMSLDLSQLALGHLREVRVQRRLGVLRIILTTEFPVHGQAYTRVEAGIGVPAANMFRGLFLVPHVIIGPLALGIERLDTEGTGRDEPAGLFSGWAKWAWTDGSRGVQVEWMRGTLRREPNSPWLIERVRQDFIVRARNQFSPAFAAEIFAGHASLEETVPPPEGSEAEEVLTERSSLQAGARAGLALPWASLSSSVRYRSFGDVPVGTADLELETNAGPLRVSADAAISTWDGSSASHAGVRAELGGLFESSTRAGASVFGELTRGTRGAPSFEAPLHDGFILSYRNGWRAGAALDLGRASGSVALVSMEQDWAWPFGVAFDRAAAPRPVGTAQGLEARGNVVLWRDHLTLSSWITDWREAEGWTYLPSRSWRTALELHALPLPSGNLEIFARAEAHMRGSVLAFDAAALEGLGEYTRMPAYTTADAYLQIRVIDVRAFIRWEDILGPIEDLPGRIQRGPRIFYGVKWQLWN